MMVSLRSPLVPVLAACMALFGCGGTSVQHGDDPGGRAGMSGTGADGGTGGTSGHGGSSPGGSGGTAASGNGGTGAGGFGGTGAGGFGGTAAGGGGRAGGASGSGGDAGGGTCETGQACSVPGSTCTLPDQCCPCVVTCTGGIWGEVHCPSCPRECPAQRPEDGDVCFPCEVPSECEWDLRPVDGPLYVGTCLDRHWVVEPKGSMPTCCTKDSECAPNLCLNGVCLPRVDGHCWNDDQCEKGELCSGGSVCGCDVVCGGPDRVGVCVPDGLDCCRDDSGCGAEEECVAGVCKERLPSGCFRDQDCTALGAVCNAPTVCPCGTSCSGAEQPGTCVIPL